MKLAHTKNKTKYWRRPTSSLVLMQQQEVQTSDLNEAGEPIMKTVQTPVYIKGRNLKNFNAQGQKSKGMASNMLINLINSNYPVTIESDDTDPNVPMDLIDETIIDPTQEILHEAQ